MGALPGLRRRVGCVPSVTKRHQPTPRPRRARRRHHPGVQILDHGMARPNGTAVTRTTGGAAAEQITCKVRTGCRH